MIAITIGRTIWSKTNWPLNHWFSSTIAAPFLVIVRMQLLGMESPKMGLSIPEMIVM